MGEENSPHPNVAEVLATQSYSGMDTTRNNRSTSPLPNLPFVFPVPSDVTSETRAHGRSSSNLAVTGSRRPASHSRPQQLSMKINREVQKAPRHERGNALPTFEFSPSSPSPIDRPPSPPRSPTRKTPPPCPLVPPRSRQLTSGEENSLR